MKTIYLDCSMGSGSDMLCGALVGLLDDRESFIEGLNNIGLDNLTYEAEKVSPRGIVGTRVNIRLIGKGPDFACSHHGTTMADIQGLISRLNMKEEIKNNVLGVYSHIAEGESAVHGVSLEETHFHEVGRIDAVATIICVCAAIDALSPDRILASPVNTGRGKVKCAHGILMIPAPATGEILKGIPIYSDDVEGELCTPTGAAILKHFAAGFIPMPIMTAEKISYGIPRREYETDGLVCCRAFLGE